MCKTNTENGGIKENFRGAWLAQSVEHVTLDLRAVSLSPTLGVEILQNNIFKKRISCIFFKFTYLFLSEKKREREREQEEEGAERKRKSQADSTLSAQSPMWGSISQTMRSCTEPKSKVGHLIGAPGWLSQLGAQLGLRS